MYTYTYILDPPTFCCREGPNYAPRAEPRGSAERLRRAATGPCGSEAAGARRAGT